MKIAEHQVSMVIRAYVKNSRDRFANAIPFHGREEPDDAVLVSEAGRRVLYERMAKQVLEKARNEGFAAEYDVGG
jgi:hypothetical protein